MKPRAPILEKLDEKPIAKSSIEEHAPFICQVSARLTCLPGVCNNQVFYAAPQTTYHIMTGANKTPFPQAAPSSARLLTGWDIDDSPRGGVHHQPPAYSNTPLANTTAFTDIQSRPLPDTFVRLYPHQKLSFARFHQVAKLPNIQRAQKLDALIKLPITHQGRIDRERLCSTISKFHYLAFRFAPAGYMYFRYEQDSDVGQTVA